MPRCINHPDRETNYVCMEHNIAMCEECLECRDILQAPLCLSCLVHTQAKAKGRKV